MAKRRRGKKPARRREVHHIHTRASAAATGGGITEIQSRTFANEEIRAKTSSIWYPATVIPSYPAGAMVIHPVTRNPVYRIADGNEGVFTPGSWQGQIGGTDESTIGTIKAPIATFAGLPVLPDADYSEGDIVEVTESRIEYKVVGNAWARKEIRSFQRAGEIAPDFPPVPFGVGQWHETLDGRIFENTATGWEEKEGGTTVPLINKFATLTALLAANPATVDTMVFVPQHDYTIGAGPQTGQTRTMPSGWFCKANSPQDGIISHRDGTDTVSYDRVWDGKNAFVLWAWVGAANALGAVDFPNGSNGIYDDGTAFQATADLVTNGSIHCPVGGSLLFYRPDTAIDAATSVYYHNCEIKQAPMPSATLTAPVNANDTTFTVDDTTGFWVGGHISIASSTSHDDRGITTAIGRVVTAMTANTLTISGGGDTVATVNGATVFGTNRLLTCKQLAGTVMTGKHYDAVFDGNVAVNGYNYSWVLNQIVGFGSRDGLRMYDCIFRNFAGEGIIHGNDTITERCKFINGFGSAWHGSTTAGLEEVGKPSYHTFFEIDNICQATAAENGHTDQYGMYTQSAEVNECKFLHGDVRNLNFGYCIFMGSVSDGMEFHDIAFEDAFGCFYHSGIPGGTQIDGFKVTQCTFNKCGVINIGTAASDQALFKNLEMDRVKFIDCHGRMHNLESSCFNKVTFEVTADFIANTTGANKGVLGTTINAVISIAGQDVVVERLKLANKGLDPSTPEINRGMYINQGSAGFESEISFERLEVRGFYKNVDYNSNITTGRKIVIDGFISITDLVDLPGNFQDKYAIRVCGQAQLRNGYALTNNNYSAIALNGGASAAEDGCTVENCRGFGSTRGFRIAGHNNGGSGNVWSGGVGTYGGGSLANNQLSNGTNWQLDEATRIRTVV